MSSRGEAPQGNLMAKYMMYYHKKNYLSLSLLDPVWIQPTNDRCKFIRVKICV